MKASKLYLHTLREAPSEIEKTSEKLLVRTGMVRKIEGSHVYLPLGYKVIRKIEEICRDVLENQGLQEFAMMAPYSEKNCNRIVKKDLKSYKELPFGFYQVGVGNKEGKSRKESMLLDAIVFDKNQEDLNHTFKNIDIYIDEIMGKCGIKFKERIEDRYNQEEELSNKFMVLSDEGKEEVAICTACKYKATKKYAKCHLDLVENDEEMLEVEEIHTPNVKTIEELNQFLDLSEKRLMKCLLLEGKDQFIAAFVRGDRELNEAKLEQALGLDAMELEFAKPEDVERITNAKTGFAGPIGLKDVTIVVDREIIHIKNGIAGANKTDYHVKNVNYGRDFKADYIVDIKKINGGDPCPKCKEVIKVQKGIEIGIINKFAMDHNALKATYKDESGKEKKVAMGSFRLDITKILDCIIGENHDENGVVWPLQVAPYHVIITIVNTKKEEQMDLGERLYKELLNSGIHVLLDDRAERAGVKFKDADLLGIPMRITVGKKAGEGIVEYKLRNEEDGEEITYNKALSNVLKRLKKEGIK